MINSVKIRYCKWKHKFGLEIHKYAKKLLYTSRKMGTDFWREADKKYRKAVYIDFDFRYEIPVDYTDIICYL